MRVDGWKPSSFEGSTRGTLSSYIFSQKDEIAKYETRYPITDADQAIAEQTHEWLVDLGEHNDDLNDYLHNLSMLAKCGSIEAKSFGLLASAIPAYIRIVEKLLMARREKLTSNHVGEVAQKGLEMILTLAARTYHDSAFGTKALMKFLDDNGNIIIWWTTSTCADDMELGARIKAKATVKRHTEFRDVKQTEVLRLKVLETLPAQLTAIPDAIATVPMDRMAA